MVVPASARLAWSPFLMNSAPRALALLALWFLLLIGCGTSAPDKIDVDRTRRGERRGDSRRRAAKRRRVAAPSASTTTALPLGDVNTGYTATLAAAGQGRRPTPGA